MTIRAVFFDYDGVLTLDKTGSLTTIRYLSERLDIPYEVISNAFQEHREKLNIGKTTHEEIWPVVCEALGRDIPFSTLAAAFDSTPKNEEMFSLATALKPNYSVGIITDNRKDRIDRLKKYQQLESLFDPIVVSAEVGCTKNEVAIFEYAVACLGISPKECVFIDNSERSLVAAMRLGMNTILFDDEGNDVGALIQCLRDRYGVSIRAA